MYTEMTDSCTYNKGTNLVTITAQQTSEQLEDFYEKNNIGVGYLHIAYSLENTGVEYRNPFLTRPVEFMSFGEEVTMIPVWFCARMPDLRIVHLHQNVTVIEESAFTGTLLHTINLESVTTIGKNAFGSTRLGGANLSSLQTVGENSFRYCRQLRKVHLPSKNITLGVGMFSGCSALRQINLENITSPLPNYIFHDCESLTRIVLSTEMREIGRGAFDGCTSLRTINLDTITTIKRDVFRKCFALTRVDLSSITSIRSQHTNHERDEATTAPGFTDITVKDTLSVALHGGNNSVSVLSYLTRPASVTFGTLAGFKLYNELMQHLLGAWTAGVKFLNVAPAPNKTVFAGGDPYIYPLNGHALKLPNTEDAYRLYQDDHVVINASVGRATPAIQREIESVRGLGDTAVISAQAHFFTHIHIACRLGESLTYDLERRIMSSSSVPQSTFSVGSPVVSRTDVPYDAGRNNSRVCIPIRWGTGMCLQIMFSGNPQVRNGVSLHGITANASGLLTRNYRPRLFRLTGLHATELVVLPKNLKRVTSNRGTVGHKEYAMLVKKMELSSLPRHECCLEAIGPPVPPSSGSTPSCWTTR
jgi:hypothetical protein